MTAAKMKIEKVKLSYSNGEVGALIVMPASGSVSTVGLFTHGYTSHKGSLLNWAMRLCESGVASLVFDLPSHYLGTFCEIDSFDEFTVEGPKLFATALDELLVATKLNPTDVKLIIGGHSLGALMALNASELPELNNCIDQHVICVGFGLPPEGVTHVFDTPFYQATLSARGQLVGPQISPDVIFPWIKEQKKSLKVTGRKVFLLSGEDDVVVGEKGTEELAKILEENGNQTFIEKPGRLAHHLPENAAPHLKKMLRDHKLI